MNCELCLTEKADHTPNDWKRHRLEWAYLERESKQRDRDIVNTQKENRRRVGTQIKERRDADIAELVKTLQVLRSHNKRHPCRFCRDLPRGPHDLKFDCESLYGLIIDRERETASCPKCKAVLAAWE